MFFSLEAISLPQSKASTHEVEHTEADKIVQIVFRPSKQVIFHVGERSVKVECNGNEVTDKKYQLIIRCKGQYSLQNHQSKQYIFTILVHIDLISNH